jgi:CTP synthase
VIESIDAKSIYEVPLLMQKEGLDKQVIQKLNIETDKPDLEKWIQFVDKLRYPDKTVKIALVGKYVEHHDSYKSIVEALIHGGAVNDAKVKIKWVQSETLNEQNIDKYLNDVSGILVAPGFGDRCVEGKYLAVQYARENKIPFFGICLGMQSAVVEFARHVAGLEMADSTEFNEKTPYPVIDLMLDQKEVTDKGGTMRLGKYNCSLVEGTHAAIAYGKKTIDERHRHRYEFNNSFKEKLTDAGLIISGVNPESDLVEIIELKDHPWFVASQFHPEFKSRPNKPHPIFTGFIEASLK